MPSTYHHRHLSKEVSDLDLVHLISIDCTELAADTAYSVFLCWVSVGELSQLIHELHISCEGCIPELMHS